MVKVWLFHIHTVLSSLFLLPTRLGLNTKILNDLKRGINIIGELSTQKKKKKSSNSSDYPITVVSVSVVVAFTLGHGCERLPKGEATGES